MDDFWTALDACKGLLAALAALITIAILLTHFYATHDPHEGP